ncbi:MAG: BolA/IbaG family iron-sulfur metabolism protein [Burkholderiales bacterium]|jgi:acid stress-induced BolA-like protein IbaG/YrbA|nr:BolA/IbaG family iron-sulfur metabolism protein [Burkholderiales bacterium]
MITTESIRQSILDGLDCEDVQVHGDGQHFEALVVSEAFNGLTRVKRHRLVYQALGARMDEEIHALSMTTLTPAEWLDVQREIQERAATREQTTRRTH